MGGSITEMSRTGLTVYTTANLPVNRCLAIKFNLNEDEVISSPLVTARRGAEDFLYHLEFVVMDEKENSKVIQAMYQYQIEQKR